MPAEGQILAKELKDCYNVTVMKKKTFAGADRLFTLHFCMLHLSIAARGGKNHG